MAHLDLQTGTYEAAETLLGRRDSRRIGHNTRLARYDSDTIAVVYHSTAIYTMTRGGWAILRTGGWTTVTTAARLNALLPGKWRVSFSPREGGLYHGGHRVVKGYADGLAVNVHTGEVAIAGRWSTDVEVILSAEDVAAAEVASQAARDRRDARRTVRLLAEHAKGEDGGYGKAEVYDYVSKDYVTAVRYHPRTWDGRHWACPRCVRP